MHDLNSYIMLKDHDILGAGPKIGAHHIGMSGPPQDDLMAKLQALKQQQS